MPFLPYLFISTVSTDKDSDSLGPQIYSFFWHFGICFEVLLQTTTIKCPVFFSNITLSKYHLEKCPVFLSIQFSLHTSDKGKINRKKSTPMIIAVMIFIFLNSYDVPKIHINSSVESLFSQTCFKLSNEQCTNFTEIHFWPMLLLLPNAV